MKTGQIRVRTKKCSLCEWTMPSWLEAQTEVDAAFYGHVSTKISGEYPCMKAEIVPIYGSENAPLAKVAAFVQALADKHDLPIKVTPDPAQIADSKCGHC